MGKLFSLSFTGRSVPYAASFLAHGAIVMAATSGAGAGAARQQPQELSIELEAPTPPERVAETVPEPEPLHHDKPITYAAHTHNYPLPANHDAVPHDPSIDHRQAAVAAPAAAVLTSPDTKGPRFSMVLGAADVSAGGLTSNTGGGGGAKTGGGLAGPSGGGEEEAPVVSVQAQLVSNVSPEYPALARDSGLEADVTLEIVVDSGGRVVESKVVRYAGHGFDESALRAIRTARFTPAQHEGSPVRVRMPWVVSFRLE
jgi:protein TonB